MHLFELFLACMSIGAMTTTAVKEESTTNIDSISIRKCWYSEGSRNSALIDRYYSSTRSLPPVAGRRHAEML